MFLSMALLVGGQSYLQIKSKRSSAWVYVVPIRVYLVQRSRACTSLLMEPLCFLSLFWKLPFQVLVGLVGVSLIRVWSVVVISSIFLSLSSSLVYIFSIIFTNWANSLPLHIGIGELLDFDFDPTDGVPLHYSRDRSLHVCGLHLYTGLVFPIFSNNMMA